MLWPRTAAAQGANGAGVQASEKLGGAMRGPGAAGAATDSRAAVAAPADTPRAMTLVDIINTHRIGSPRLSPDGKRLVYVQSDADWKKDERVSHLWLVNADGTGARQLTRGEDGESDPRWSPDGTRIAFLAARKGSCEAPEEAENEKGEGSEAKPDPGAAADTTPAACDPEHPHRQVWVLSLQGGEARPLTHHASSVSDITWSPDGRWVYFTAPDPETKAEAARKKAKNDVYAFDENYHQVHLWRVDARPAGEAEPEAPVSSILNAPYGQPSSPRTLEGEARHEERVTHGDFSVVSYSLSADGKKAALERGPTPLYGDAGKDEVWVVGTDGTGMVRVTEDTVPEYGPELSPDGRRVLFTSMSNRNLEFYYNPNLFVVDVPEPGQGPARPGATSGPAVRMLLPEVPWEMQQAHWSEDGSHILVLANEGVREDLFRVSAITDKAGGMSAKADTPERLTPEGDHSIGSWSYEPAAGASVFTIEGTSPGDVWTLAQGKDGAARGTARQLTHRFDDFASRWKLPREEAVTWQGKDGQTVQGLLFYPLGWKAGGRRHPLVVQAHGGPMSSSRFGFQSVYNYVPVLARLGYFVLQPNYRGSTGYGDAFMRDMLGHYYQEAHLDVLAGVDALVQRGLVSPDSLVMMGWSAGGHMTDKLITFTDRFKAASSGAGASDWISMYAQSDVRVYRTPWFGGSPWQKDAPIAAYWDNSPLKDVWKVKTPTLFMVGHEDPRVPMPQSVEMYRGVKATGTPTHLYVAPREPHGWQELRHRLFKANVELEWFQRWVRGAKWDWERAPGDSETQAVDSAAEIRAGG
ncbi:MAG: S9 family peptidase [Candidatus Palauibacterales bacterium]|nr:S9 family peptidase [Candidatus Palauibacterales bacterium]